MPADIVLLKVTLLIMEIPEKTEKIDFSINNFRPRTVKNTYGPLFLLVEHCSSFISERNGDSDKEID